MTEEKDPGITLSTVGAFPAAPQATPAPGESPKADTVLHLSQVPPMSLTGAKPVVDKPTTVIAPTLKAIP